jgi:hypothetical protein
MVERAIGVRINLGHHVSTSNPAVLLKNLMVQQESRVLYATPNTPRSLFMRVFSLLSGSVCCVRMTLSLVCRYTKQQNAGQFLHRINVSMVSQRKRAGEGAARNHISVENDESGRQLEDE